MTLVRIRLEKSLYSPGGARSGAGDVVADVWRLGSAATELVERVLIPTAAPDALELDLDNGTYSVAATLPSSEVVSRDVEVIDEPLDVVLRGTYSPREWLSWHHLVGTVSQTAVEFADTPGAPRRSEQVSVLRGQRGEELDAMAAYVASALGGDAVNRAASDLELMPEPREWHRDGAYSAYVIESAPYFEGFGTYVRARLEGGGELLGVLPDPWPPVGSQPARSDVLLAPEPGSPSNAVCSITVQDPLMTTVIGYLGAGAIPAAADVLEPARKMLFRKISNPVAAAAGGYILLGAWKGDPAQEREWFRWLHNLANWFKWLPDGAIQHGWRTLRAARHRRHVVDARGYLLQAQRRGLPFYAAGVRMLLEGLTVLAHDAPDDREVSRALIATRTLAMHTDPRSPFTVIALPKSEGDLP